MKIPILVIGGGILACVTQFLVTATFCGLVGVPGQNYGEFAVICLFLETFIGGATAAMYLYGDREE